MRLYFIALKFLAIIPLPASKQFDERDLGRSMAFFPLAGLTLGALLAAADLLISKILPGSLTDIILVSLLAVVTGALHLDGVADVFDAVAARGNKERFLAIMKDSRVGAIGAVALILTLMLKYISLNQLPPLLKTNALLFFPMAARYGQVLMTVGAKRARSDGLGASFITGAGFPQLAVASVMTFGTGFLLLGCSGMAVVLIVSIVTILFRSYFQHRLGGITGDIIGCCSELNEISSLILIIALAGIK